MSWNQNQKRRYRNRLVGHFWRLAVSYQVNLCIRCHVCKTESNFFFNWNGGESNENESFVCFEFLFFWRHRWGLTHSVCVKNPLLIKTSIFAVQFTSSVILSHPPSILILMEITDSICSHSWLLISRVHVCLFFHEIFFLAHFTRSNRLYIWKSCQYLFVALFNFNCASTYRFFLICVCVCVKKVLF